MKKKINRFIPIPFRSPNLVSPSIIVVVIVLFILYLTSEQSPNLDQYFQAKSNQTINNTTPTVTYNRPTIDPNQKGFSGYEENWPWFDLTLPNECSIGNAKIIACITPNFTLEINPQAGGRGAMIKEAEVIILNGYTWERKFIDPQSEQPTTSTYYLKKTPDNQSSPNVYLIEVKYDPFTPESQQYFESILSTFRFID